MYSKVLQLYFYKYLFFFRFFSIIGDPRILNRVPCALQEGLAVYFRYSNTYPFIPSS